GVVGQALLAALGLDQPDADQAVEELRKQLVDLRLVLRRQVGRGIQHVLAGDWGAVDGRNHLGGIGRGGGRRAVGGRRRGAGRRSLGRGRGRLGRRGRGRLGRRGRGR